MRQRIVVVIRRQWREIQRRRGDAVYQTLMSIAGLPLAPVIALAMRLLRPWISIRLGKLTSVRIGHFAGNTEVYLCERDAGLHGSPRKTLDIFYHSQAVSNSQLKRMWDRALFVTPLVTFADLLSRKLPGGQYHAVPMRELTGDRDIYGLVSASPPHLTWTTEEEARGRNELKRLGIPEGTSFICFAARDKAFLDQGVIGWRDWRYHDYRNADIANYLPAVTAMTKCGYRALRMGAVVEKPIDPAANDRIIDYATKFRSDFLDIYLLSKCRFFLGDTSGLFLVPFIFRRPIVVVNYVVLSHVPEWGAQDLFIPKKLWLRRESRFLMFKEIVESGIGGYFYSEQYEDAGIDLIENTADEISDVTAEMEARLNGTWRKTDEDDDLQAKFWSCFDGIPVRKTFPPRIGAAFLRRHRELLK